MQRRIIKRLGVLAGGFVLAGGLAAAPALAQQGCTPDNSGTVCGSLSINSTLTLALSGDSFSLSLPAGGTSVATGTGASAPVTAKVTTNNGSGYNVSESLATKRGSDNQYGFLAANGTDLISASDFFAYAYPAGSTAGGAFENTSFNKDSGSDGTIASSTTISAGSGDSYPLGWQFVGVPASQASGTYTAEVDVVALVNP